VEVPLRFKQIAAAALLCSGLAAQAQVALSEGFDDVAALTGAGWSIVNTSPAPGTTWFQGNSGIFPSASGAANSYVAANFLGTTATSGPVSNWLITPQLALDATSTVSMDVRVAGDGFFDSVEVLISTTGTAPADFSLIGSYGSSTDAGWVAQSFGAGLTAATSAYVAFRYVIDDVAVNGDYLGIDNVLISSVPEPTTALLLGLGLAGLLARRRFSA
jgi:hypothetical protein